eukprot:1996140-Amphidinium_carterae.1
MRTTCLRKPGRLPCLKERDGFVVYWKSCCPANTLAGNTQMRAQFQSEPLVFGRFWSFRRGQNLE